MRAKIITFLIGTLLLFSTTSFGQIPEELSITSDFRLRYEINDVDGKENLKDRQRIRFRFGMKYKTETIEMGGRLATNSGNLQSPHQTLGTLDGSSNKEFGLDRAYLTMKFNTETSVTLGKAALNYWQQNEVLFDNDLSPEGISASYRLPVSEAELTLNSGYYILKEENDAEGIFQDDNLLMLQGVFTTGSTVFKSTSSVGYGKIIEAGVVDGVFEERKVFSIAQQFSNFFYLPLIAGFDYITSDADNENSAFIIMLKGKYQDFGWGIWYYDVAENSTLYSGFSQDNWPASVGFSGVRLQFDFKLVDNVKSDFRIYQQNMDSGIDDTIRYQLNINFTI